MTIGTRLRSGRERLEISQPELGRLCGWRDAKQRIPNYETGIRVPRIPDLHKLAGALGVPVEWLAFGTDPGASLSEQERYLLQHWREALPAMRSAGLAVLTAPSLEDSSEDETPRLPPPSPRS